MHELESDETDKIVNDIEQYVHQQIALSDSSYRFWNQDQENDKEETSLQSSDQSDTDTDTDTENDEVSSICSDQSDPELHSMLSKEWVRKYKRSLAKDQRKFEEIDEEELERASGELLNIIKNQKSYFTLEEVRYYNTGTILEYEISCLAKEMLRLNTDISFNISFALQYLLKNPTKFPNALSILTEGYDPNDLSCLSEDERSNYKLKMKPSRYNIAHLLAAFDDAASIALVHDYQIDLNKAKILFTPLQVAILFNAGRAAKQFSDLKASLLPGSLQVTSSNSNLLPSVETPFEFAAYHFNYEVLPHLSIDCNAFNTMLSNKPSSRGYSHAKTFIESLLAYSRETEKFDFDQFFSLLWGSLIAREDIQYSVDETKYKIFKTIEYFLKNQWPFPSWFEATFKQYGLLYVAEEGFVIDSSTQNPFNLLNKEIGRQLEATDANQDHPSTFSSDACSNFSVTVDNLENNGETSFGLTQNMVCKKRPLKIDDEYPPEEGSENDLSAPESQIMRLT